MSERPDLNTQLPPVPIAGGLAYVCRYMDDIREVLRSDGVPADSPAPLVVRRVVEAARLGADLREPLDALHAALLAAGDPLGVWGKARSLMPAGMDASVPFEALYACPHDYCSGHTAATAATISFTCSLTRQPLRREAL